LYFLFRVVVRNFR